MDCLAVESDREMRAVLRLLEARLEAEVGRQPEWPGLAAAVVLDQELLWSKGFGHANVESGQPVTGETLFGVGSITKLFTATALLQLRDAGLICLDEPLRTYIPEFRIGCPFPDTRPITVRQVLGHRAGLPMDAPLDCWDTLSFPDEETLLASLERTRLTCPPMTEYRYGNLAFALLGVLIGRVAKTPYRDNVQERILQPLGMAATTFKRPSNGEVPAAQGYAAPHGGPLKATPWPDTGAYAPALQLMTSAEDFAKFLSLQFRAADGDTGEVLDACSLREMHWPAYIHHDWKTAQGISWAIERIAGETVHRHAGATFGFQATCSFVQRLRFGVILFANFASAPLDGLRREMLALLIPEFARRQRMAERSRAIPPVSSEVLERLVGKYAHPAGFSLEFSEIDGRLLILDSDAAGKPVSTLTPLTEYSYRVIEGVGTGEKVEFFFNGSGGAHTVHLGSYVFYRV